MISVLGWDGRVCRTVLVLFFHHLSFFFLSPFLCLFYSSTLSLSTPHQTFSFMLLTCLSFSCFSSLCSLLSCIHTYYCINQHHNFLVMIHVNYDLVKLRAKRTGYVKSGVYVHTKKMFFSFLLCLLQFSFVQHCLRVFVFLFCFSEHLILKQTTNSMFLLACWQDFFCYRSFSYKSV